MLRFTLLFCSGLLWAETSIHFGVLKEIPSASYLIFYNGAYGYIDCIPHSVITPDAIRQTKCDISRDNGNKLAFYARLYARRTLHLEQKYKIDITNGYCIIYNGAHVYNEQLLKDGYGMRINRDTTDDKAAWRKELDKMVIRAKEEKRGPWWEWAEEMDCLKAEATSFRP